MAAGHRWPSVHRAVLLRRTGTRTVTDDRGSWPLRAIFLSTSLSLTYMLPMFLAGSLAVLIDGDFPFGPTAMGVAVGLYWLTATLASPSAGRLVDRIGAFRSARLAAAVAVLTPIGIATTAFRWETIALWLAFGGLGMGIGQPAANRLLASNVQPGRLGAAFGIKQSSAPGASVIAGLSLPLVGVTIGWRWAFGFAGGLAAAVLVEALRSRSGGSSTQSPPDLSIMDRRVVTMMAVAFGLAVAASSVITTFFVVAAVAEGFTASTAGALLSIAGVSAVGVRLALGVAADRMSRGHLHVCAGMLGVGAIGIALLAVGGTTATMVGVVAATAGAWGMNGVFWFSLVRAYSASPGRVTGLVAPGSVIGSIAGPVLFGTVVDRSGFRPAWLGLVVVALAAGAGMLLCARRLPSPAESTGAGRDHASGTGPTEVAGR
jgi:MFS family permease